MKIFLRIKSKWNANDDANNKRTKEKINDSSEQIVCKFHDNENCHEISFLDENEAYNHAKTTLKITMPCGVCTRICFCHDNVIAHSVAIRRKVKMTKWLSSCSFCVSLENLWFRSKVFNWETHPEIFAASKNSYAHTQRRHMPRKINQNCIPNRRTMNENHKSHR